MKEIIITIKPTLNDISDPQELIECLDQVNKLITSNKDLVLEAVGEKILEKAKSNAEQGYTGVPYAGDSPVIWPQRDPATERLYRLSPYHQDFSETGLDTGRHKLINSLDRLGEDNIFEVGNNKIEVGTRFEQAALLENGGIRANFPNIGFNIDGSMKRWLLEAVSKGLISIEEVNDIRSQFFRPQIMPARPFLRPALRDIRDRGEHTDICVKTLLIEMKVDLDLRKMNSKAGDMIVES